MSKVKISLKDAEEARNEITKDNLAWLSKRYDQWSEEIGREAEKYSHNANASAPLKEAQLRDLQAKLKAMSGVVNKEVEDGVRRSIYLTAASVVDAGESFLKSVGLEKTGIGFSNVPDQIVDKLATGKIYKEGWTLSKSIWSDAMMVDRIIYTTVAGGVAQNKSVYEIAKDIERFVKPGAKLDWNLRDKDGMLIYPKRVEYNAQRLVRTMTQHAYQQSMIELAKDNPLIEEFEWISGGSRACEMCLDMDGRRFKKNEVPMDHPNGMCSMNPVVGEDIVDKLADWVLGEDGEWPEMDKFATNFGYTRSPTSPALKKIQDLAKNKIEDKPVSPKERFDRKKWDAMWEEVPTSTLDEWGNEWINDLTPAEKRIIREYTEDDYLYMNQLLRGIADMDELHDMFEMSEDEMWKNIELLQGAMNKAAIPRDIITRRTVEYDATRTLFDLAGVDWTRSNVPEVEDLVGVIIQDKGFLSTTPSSESDFHGGGSTLHILLPEGTKAGYVDPISAFSGEEYELLVNSGVKFYIEEVKLNSLGNPSDIYMRALLP